jgi:predicted Zn-dependent protease
MTVLSESEARAILEKALAYSKADGCEANLNGNEDGNIRYARNTVTTAGTVKDLTLVVQSNFGTQMGTATINEFDDGSIEKVVRRSEELASLAPENPEFMPVLGPQKYTTTEAFYDSTANIDAGYRAQAAADSIEPCKKQELVAAGFLNDSTGFMSMINSAGLFAYHRETTCDFSVTIRSEDGTGSGWVERAVNDVTKLSTAEASAVAMKKAAGSRDAKAIEPGKYTVILEPSAANGLLQNMMFSLNARTADEGRSFLSKAGGGNKVGEKLVDERVSIYSDPSNEDVPVSPWSQDGQARRPTHWIRNGVVETMFRDRFWAKETEQTPVPFPANGIMDGTDTSLEDLIKDTKRGILVTRLWYIRNVDPQTLLYTGLTRDGTFFIENGKIAHPIKNLRFNESPIIMLNNLEALGQPTRIGTSMIPAIKVRDFTFTSLSDAV